MLLDRAAASNMKIIYHLFVAVVIATHFHQFDASPPDTTAVNYHQVLNDFFAKTFQFKEAMEDFTGKKTCRHLGDAFDKGWTTYKTAKNLEFEHYLFIVIDNLIYAKFKTYLLQMKRFNSAAMTPNDAKNRNAILSMIEEIQRIDVNTYKQFQLEEQEGKVPNDLAENLVKACRISQKVLGTIVNCFLGKNQYTISNADKQVCFSVTRELRRMTSPLNTVFEEGRIEMRTITRTMFQMEEATQNNAFPGLIETVITSARKLYSRLIAAHNEMSAYHKEQEKQYAAEETELAELRVASAGDSSD